MRRAIALALAAPLALVAGCLTLGPRSEPARWYVLEAEASAPGSTRPPMPVLGVGPVRLPAYLDRPEIVTRAGPARVEVASADRWAAPLDVLFTGVLAEDLRAAVPAREVLGWPWPVSASPEWSVSVEVLRFEGEPDGSAVLEARWAVRRGGALAKQGVTTARERGAAPGVAATVAALSRAIGALARDIAAAVGASRGDAPRGTP
ncbi:PqiC family protein [Anaeromyxobacter terrae]|uniref:PqiC family protein n=1 Tax=Anaeromyxobacter terrae TaxID=2925406 RepID=UPI001F5A1607|nr:PqiC family protein [Anaeromyxobacter sp. SG22]